jgi:predicted AAA+ superfamily ATPase
MNYIPRYLERKILDLSGFFKAVLVTGQRQTGKTTMLKHLAEGQNRGYVSLDNPADRELAKNDPSYFLQIHKPPLMIDEVQYAPELFPAIKIACDNSEERGLFWLTGSQRYSMMKNVRESLAGRIGISELHCFSRNEMYGAAFGEPLQFDLESLKNREAQAQSADTKEIFNFIWQGGMPQLINASPENRDYYYQAYTETYLMRDAVELGGIKDTLRFFKFCQACAAETSYLLNYKNLAEAAEVSLPTAKEWFNLLYGMGILFTLPAYSNNALKKLVKAPKFYFHDTGLCAYLARWPTAEILMCGAASGAFFENFVISEILKAYSVSSREPGLYYYRDANQIEIDLLVDDSGVLHPLEIKKAALPDVRKLRRFDVLDRAAAQRGMGGFICCHETLSPIDRENCRIPAWIL